MCCTQIKTKAQTKDCFVYPHDLKNRRVYLKYEVETTSIVLIKQLCHAVYKFTNWGNCKHTMWK